MIIIALSATFLLVLLGICIIIRHLEMISARLAEANLSILETGVEVKKLCDIMTAIYTPSDAQKEMDAIQQANWDKFLEDKKKRWEIDEQVRKQEENLTRSTIRGY